VAGLAAFGGIAGATGASGLTNGSSNWGSLPSAATQVLAADTDPAGNAGQNNGGQSGGTVELVPCAADRLIAAIVRANASGGAQLKLTQRCTYTLTATQGPDGLPIVTQPIGIDGQGATIVRAANAANFRILNVGTGGNLKLEDLTVKGGVAPNSRGGGGILVESGGQATLRNTTVAYNQSTAVGGGIANYGVTTVLGGDDHGNGSGSNSSAPSNGPDNAPANGPTQASPSGQSGGSTMTAGTEQSLSKVDNNNAQTSGGGIYNEGRLTTNNVEVSYNNSNVEGGGLSDQKTAVLEKTRIDRNTAANDGGGIDTFNSVTTIKDSSVSDNTASTGGGISNVQSTIYVQGSKVDRNTANGTDGAGGIFNFASPLIAGPTFAVVEDSEVNGNTATHGNGGGISNRLSRLVLRRSHVSLNKATGTTSQGGGIFNTGFVDLTAVQVTENTSTVAPGGISTNNNLVTVDQKSVIIKNRPTNCTGSPNAVPNCFG
jgi:hypothetical protein